ncbi:hypothetical protein [Pedobacter psychrophilus]|uniref:hypothetical protein n=1 Tax=Pedobacter psychrophilus TaxID=1826909 RepID=UPI000A43D1D0|nr:hypothetical protein [Pedobacter psychrophilus]
MKRVLLITLSIIWCFSLMMLIAALTDLFHIKVLHEYRLLVGLSFLLISAIMRTSFKKLTSIE